MGSCTTWKCNIPAELAGWVETFRQFQDVAAVAIQDGGDWLFEGLGPEPPDGDTHAVDTALCDYAALLGISAGIPRQHVQLVGEGEADGACETCEDPDGSATMRRNDGSELFGWEGFHLAVRDSLALAGSAAEVRHRWVGQGAPGVEGAGEVVITAGGISR